MNQSIQQHRAFSSGGPLRAAHPAAMARASLSDLLRLMDPDAETGPESDSLPVTLRPLRAGTALFHEHGQVDAIHFVSMGSFKIYRTAEDGYEQVLGFARRGEVLGYDAVCLGQHPTAAVALEDARVFAISVRELFPLLHRVPALDRLLHLAVSRQLTRAAEIADLMAAVAAEVRLARFLVLQSEQMKACGQSPVRLLLRMGRRDIASHLGVAHETVSRSFSVLADWGWLHVNNREVEILDLAQLKTFARSTRRSIDDIGVRAKANSAAAELLPRSNALELSWVAGRRDFGFDGAVTSGGICIDHPRPQPAATEHSHAA